MSEWEREVVLGVSECVGESSVRSECVWVRGRECVGEGQSWEVGSVRVRDRVGRGGVCGEGQG